MLDESLHISTFYTVDLGVTRNQGESKILAIAVHSKNLRFSLPSHSSGNSDRDKAAQVFHRGSQIYMPKVVAACVKEIRMINDG